MNELIVKYEKQIKTIQEKITKIQSLCNHENNKSEYDSSTGGYDPSSDCWWICVKCLDCGKHMRFDSVKDSEFYRDKRWKK